jgi:hypothetical protein
MRIRAKRHEYTENGFEVETGCHATKRVVNTSKSQGAARSNMRFGVGDNGFDQVVDFARSQVITADFAEVAQSLSSNMTNALVRVGDKSLRSCQPPGYV